MIERIGFASQYASGEWSPLFATAALARNYAREAGTAINRRMIAVPVLIDIPDVPPRPTVVLASGDAVRWNATAAAYRCNGVSYASVVEVVKALDVTDADVDALQALPGDTAAWRQAGGVGAD